MQGKENNRISENCGTITKGVMCNGNTRKRKKEPE